MGNTLLTLEQMKHLIQDGLNSLQHYDSSTCTAKAKACLAQVEAQLEQWKQQLEREPSLCSDSIDLLLQSLEWEMEHCRMKLKNSDVQIDWRFDYYRLIRGLKHDVFTLKQLAESLIA